MTLGNILASKRKLANLTQQQVGDALNVSPQAVSKWENDLAQPDLIALKRLAELYNVPVSQLIDAADEQAAEASEPAPEPEPAPAPQPTVTYIEVPQKPVLAVCEDCNKPIYDGKDIVRRTQHHGKSPSTNHVYCSVCAKKRDRITAINQMEEAKKSKKLAIGWGIAFAVIVGVGLGVFTPIHFWAILLAFCTFCLTGCVFIDESFVGDMWQNMISWSFHAPGVIFDLSLDGVLWLIAVKILFWIIGVLFAIAAFLVGTAIGFLFAPFAVIYDYVQNGKEIKDCQNKINEADAFIKSHQ